jgi:hypothetical protein
MSEPSTPAVSAGPALTHKLKRCHAAADPDGPQPQPASTVMQALDLQNASNSDNETDHHLSVSTDNSPDTSKHTPKQKRNPKGSKKAVS